MTEEERQKYIDDHDEGDYGDRYENLTNHYDTFEEYDRCSE